MLDLFYDIGFAAGITLEAARAIIVIIVSILQFLKGNTHSNKQEVDLCVIGKPCVHIESE